MTTAVAFPAKIATLRQRQKAKQQLCTCIRLFCTFLSLHCTTTTWNDQILSFFEDGNSKTINSTISVWTRARPPLFSCNINSLLLSNWATWDNREMVWKDAKSIFQRPFNGRRRCRIVRSLMTLVHARALLSIESNSSWRYNLKVSISDVLLPQKTLQFF